MFRVGGVVKTMRGAQGVDGKKENYVNDYDVATEEAREAWKNDVKSDLSNMDWRITGVAEITKEEASEAE